jgi:IS30 family transposase
MNTRKNYYNLMDKSINVLLKTIYQPVTLGGVNATRNRLTYQNIQNLKQAIRQRRNVTNTHIPVRNNNREFTVRQKLHGVFILIEQSPQELQFFDASALR